MTLRKEASRKTGCKVVRRAGRASDGLSGNGQTELNNVDDRGWRKVDDPVYGRGYAATDTLQGSIASQSSRVKA
jgi:hypothetical protein